MGLFNSLINRIKSKSEAKNKYTCNKGNHKKDEDEENNEHTYQRYNKRRT